MRNSPALLRLGRILVAGALLPGSLLPLQMQASDHADPMSLNMLMVQEDPIANITDLHAFIVDAQGKRILDPAQLSKGERIVISLCVRRALRPQDAEGLDVSGFKFVVHLDMDPEVRFFDETKTRDGEDYAKTLAALNAQIQEAAAASAKAVPASLEKAQIDNDLAKARASLASLLRQRQSDAMMQALYGGIIPHPDAIADGTTLTFELLQHKDGVNSNVSLKSQQLQGIPGPVSIFTDKPLATKDFDPSTTYIQAGIFDDPFIFPRFFRRNVVGIVTSIPLSQLLKNSLQGPILLWATTQKEGQIDHVGRSLRTQLPRFGYLNDKPPALHVDAIMKVHDKPNLVENFTATFLSPLIAHRHYDSVPDVMIYDLRKPALFPNGRGFEDDVAKTLADAGETLLYELSYAESSQYPRATRNDREFKPDFPYLADRWTQAQIDAAIPGTPRNPAPGPSSATTVPGDQFQRLEAEQTGYVSQAPDASAIAAPNLKDYTWRTLWFFEIAALAVLTTLLLITLRSKLLRWFTIGVAVLTVWWLQAVYAANVMGLATQPQDKLTRLIFGGIILAILAAGWLIALGRRTATKWPPDLTVYPKGDQGVTQKDKEPPPSSYQEISTALFDSKINGQYYQVWGAPGNHPLPLYKQTFGSIARGLWRIGKDFDMLKAAKRTLKTRADLRWGNDGKGFRRLVHPIGICLEGEWSIDPNSPFKDLTGYFAPGKKGRVIARYSLGGNEPRNGHYRSLGLVGKLFPQQDSADGPTPRAHFITQEDLGGAFTNSIKEVELANSPPVTLWKRKFGLLPFLVVIRALMEADEEPAERQLYEIAELEKPAGTPTNCPRFLRFILDDTHPVDTRKVDFREEILHRMYDPGVETPQRDLVFTIQVSIDGKRKGKIRQTLVGQDWKNVGKLTFKKAVPSYNGDFVIHFHHPVWRNDPNQPSSVARADLINS